MPVTGRQHLDWFRLIRLSGWSLTLYVLVALAVLVNDQAIDATRALATTSEFGVAFRLGIAVIAALGAGVINWQTIRRIQIAVEGKPRPGDIEIRDAFGHVYPRLLGCTPLAALALQYSWVGLEYWFPRPSLGNADWLSRAACCLVVLCVSFGLACLVRGKISQHTSMRLTVSLPVALVIIVPTVGGTYGLLGWPGAPAVSLIAHSVLAWGLMFGLYFFAAHWREQHRNEPAITYVSTQSSGPAPRGRRLARWSFWLLVGVVACLTILPASFPDLGQLIGSLAVVFAALGMWAGVGNTVIRIGIKLRWHRRLNVLLRRRVNILPKMTRPLADQVYRLRGVPLWGACLVAALVVQLTIGLGTNQVRTTQDSLRAVNRLPITDDPIVIIAAEGGGIYAAYHAAQVLSLTHQHALHEGDKDGLPGQITVATGVSGGAVGIGVFAAAVSVDLQDPQISKTIDRTLSRDLLSPTLSAMLGRNVLPLPWPALDRARALEDALVDAWSDAVGSEHACTLWLPLRELATRAGFHLMFNTTRVEDGLQYHDSSFELHRDAYQLHPKIKLQRPLQALPAVTSMFLSARFPLVTPSGCVPIIEPCNSQSRDAFFVDGGYHENSGAAGALAIVQHVNATNATPRDIRIVFIGAVDRAVAGNNPHCQAASDTPALRGDLRRPLDALNATRGAHRQRIRQQLDAQDNVRILDVTLSLQADSGLRVPLGWILSNRSRMHIRDELVDNGVPKLVWEFIAPTSAPATDGFQ